MNPVKEYMEDYFDPDSLETAIPALLEMDSLKKTYIELYGEVGRDFASNVMDFVQQHNKSLLKTDEDLWQQWMEDWAAREAGVKIVSMNTYAEKEMKRLIRKVMNEGVEAGLGRDEIARNIRKTLPKAWDEGAIWKAKRVAQTEVIGASNRASFTAASQTGYNMNKTWLPAPPGIAKTERHTLPGALMEYTIPINEKFQVSPNGGGYYEAMDCPGDGSAENVINCMCTLTYEVI